MVTALGPGRAALTISPAPHDVAVGAHFGFRATRPEPVASPAFSSKRMIHKPWGFSSRVPWAASAPALVALPLRMYSKQTAIIAPMIGPTR
jgi:hypothetical protein